LNPLQKLSEHPLQGSGAGPGGGSPYGDRSRDLPLAAQNRNKNLSSSHPSAAPNKSPEKKRRYLSAEKKFQIYLAAQASGQPVGEVLRREGLFSTDLARIRQQGSRKARSSA
jgi:hypothetical protein